MTGKTRLMAIDEEVQGEATKAIDTPSRGPVRPDEGDEENPES